MPRRAPASRSAPASAPEIEIAALREPATGQLLLTDRSGEFAAAAYAATNTLKGRRVSDSAAYAGNEGGGFGLSTREQTSLSLASLRTELFAQTVNQKIHACRQVAGRLGFIERWVALKRDHVLEGLRLKGPGRAAFIAADPNETWRDVLKEIAGHYLLTHNAVVNWWVDQSDALARPLALDPAEVGFRNPGGIGQVRLADWTKALGGGQLARDSFQEIQSKHQGWLTLGSDLEDDLGLRFLVFSGADLGAGYAVPSLYAAVIDCAIVETLRMGDFNASFVSRDIPRQIKKGHEIKYSDLAGQPLYFLKGADVTRFKETLKDKIGAWDWITNFDVSMEFPFLDPKFYDAHKYDAAWSRLIEWAGPLATALRAGAGEAGAIAMGAARTEGMALRDQLRRHFIRLLNHPDYRGGPVPPDQRVDVAFNPLTWHGNREAREWLSFGLVNGTLSPQTCTETMGFDPEEEQERIKAARADKDSFTPVFEAKQGIVAGTLASQPSAEPAPNGRPPQGEA